MYVSDYRRVLQKEKERDWIMCTQAYLDRSNNFFCSIEQWRKL